MTFLSLLKACLDDDSAKPVYIGEMHGFEVRVGLHSILHSYVGYVRIPEGHQVHGFRYDGLPDWASAVHGGVTFAGEAPPLVGSPPGFWLGFDCSHGGDYVPLLAEELEKYGATRPAKPLRVWGLPDVLTELGRWTVALAMPPMGEVPKHTYV